MKRLLLLLLMALATPAIAGTELNWAQPNRTFATGDTTTRPRVAKINVAVVGGINAVDTSGTPMQFDELGRLLVTDPDRDRDRSVMQSLLLSTNLNAGKAVRGAVKSLTEFGKGTLLVTWGTAVAADSDSVNISVTLAALSSQSSGNRYNLATTPASSGVDSSWAFRSTGFQTFSPMPTYYITRNGYTWLAPSGSLAANPIRFPLSVYRLGASTNGIAIPLADLTGAPFPMQYVEVTVANLNPRVNLTSVQVDYWPRIN